MLLNAFTLSLSPSLCLWLTQRGDEKQTLQQIFRLSYINIYMCIVVNDTLQLPPSSLFHQDNLSLMVSRAMWSGGVERKKNFAFSFLWILWRHRDQMWETFYSWSHFFIQFFFVFFELLSIQRLPFLCTTAKLM